MADTLNPHDLLVIAKQLARGTNRGCPLPIKEEVKSHVKRESIFRENSY